MVSNGKFYNKLPSLIVSYPRVPRHEVASPKQDIFSLRDLRSWARIFIPSITSIYTIDVTTKIKVLITKFSEKNEIRKKMALFDFVSACLLIEKVES